MEAGTKQNSHAASARYVRVIGREPDGQDQRGGQMRILELEVYR